MATSVDPGDGASPGVSLSVDGPYRTGAAPSDGPGPWRVPEAGDEPPTDSGVPAGRFERIYDAALRGGRQLPGEVQAQLAPLFEPWNLFALAVLLVLQVTPIGWLADLYGAYGLVKDLLRAKDEIVAWVSGATNAKTEADLTAAGTHFARMVSIVGVDAILAVIGAELFKRLRAKIKSRFSSSKGAGEGSSPEGEIASEEKPSGEQKPKGEEQKPKGEEQKPKGEEQKPKGESAVAAALLGVKGAPPPVPSIPSIPWDFIFGALAAVATLVSAAVTVHAVVKEEDQADRDRERKRKR